MRETQAATAARQSRPTLKSTAAPHHHTLNNKSWLTPKDAASLTLIRSRHMLLDCKDEAPDAQNTPLEPKFLKK